MLIALLGIAAHAGEVTHDFDIPAQPLANALKLLSRQAGMEIMADGDVLRGTSTGPVQGRLSLQQALQKLLNKTGLEYRLLGGNQIAIKRSATPKEEPATLDTVHIVGYPPLGDGTLYNPPEAASATKTQTPLMETPVGIEVVPEQVMRDQQITRIADALKNVSGVSSSPSGVNGDFDFLFIRGFYYGWRIYRDGVPLKVAQFTNGQRDTANIARLEVVKGPPSLLYGRTDPGGMVNIITKQPEIRPYHSFTQQFGSWDLFRTTLDSTGPLTADKSLSYRFNFDFEKSNSFRDFVYHDRKFFSPVLRWDVSPQTRISFEAEYREGETLVDPGLPLINGTNEIHSQHPGRLPNVPISNFYGGPDDKHQSQEALFGVHWSHAFNDDWTLRHRFNAVIPNTNSQGFQLANTATARWYTLGTPEGTPFNDHSILLWRRHFSDRSTVYYNTVTLNGHFQTLGLDHTLLIGADHQRTSDDYREVSYLNPKDVLDRLSDLHHPLHPVNFGSPSGLWTSSLGESWFGLYLQDQVKLPFGVQFLAGMRYDDASEHTSTTDTTLPDGARSHSNARSHDTAVTPRFGLLWQPVRQVSWYGNYSENFGLPNAGSNRFARPLGPERAHQWETGIKTEWLDGRLNANLAAFRIIKSNVASNDAACPLNQYCPATLGKLQSQGLELDIKGEPLPQWKLIGTYTFLETEVLKDIGFNGSPGATGQNWASKPKHMGSLWTTYEWIDGPLAGFTLGGGTVIRGPLQDGVREPGYALLNLMAAYSFNAGPSQLTLQLNIDNLLDKTYYLGSDYWLADEYPGTPRNVMGSVRVQW